jgi:hypothetical protein
MRINVNAGVEALVDVTFGAAGEAAAAVSALDGAAGLLRAASSA